MTEISRIGMDTSKHVFQLHCVDAEEQVVGRSKLRRRLVLEFFAKQAPTTVGIEACGSAHYWARELGRLGHTVKLLPPLPPGLERRAFIARLERAIEDASRALLPDPELGEAAAEPVDKSVGKA